MIKNLIFDFGKVLVDYDFKAFFRKYIPNTERCQAFTPVLYNEELQQLLDRQERPFEVIMEEWIENHKEFEHEIRYFNEHYPEIVTNEVEGMYELLTKLKAEGYKLYGLTNWCSKVYLTMAQSLSSSFLTDRLSLPKRRSSNQNQRFISASSLSSI